MLTDPTPPDDPAAVHSHTTKPLSARHVRFCRLYVEHGNATRAYREAGLRHANDNVAAVEAFRLLRKPKIRACIRELQQAAADAARVSLSELVAQFRRVCDVRITDALNSDGSVKPPDEWPDNLRLACVRCDVEEIFDRVPDPENPGRTVKAAVGRRWKIAIENKTECRKVLAQWLGMIGPNRAEDKTAGHQPLVVGGEADPHNL